MVQPRRNYHDSGRDAERLGVIFNPKKRTAIPA